MFKLVYKSKPVSGELEPSLAHAVIFAMPISRAERDHLWLLWACADAIIDAPDDEIMSAEVPILALLCYIEDPAFGAATSGDPDHAKQRAKMDAAIAWMHRVAHKDLFLVAA